MNAHSETTAPVRPGADARSRRRGALARRETLSGYGFLFPWLLGFFGLTIGPMLFSLYLSFTKYNLFTAPQWIGADNYVRLFTDDPVFLKSVTVTLQYVFIGTPVKLLAALAVAMLLNRFIRGSGFFRSSFYVPSLIGASISVAIVWRAMFATHGPVDDGLSFFGIKLGGWIGNPDLSLPMMIILAVWQFGAPMVIFLAGLKQVPTELYEAAEVDGAGSVRKFWNVTVPMLSPVIFFNLLLETINAFQIFGSAYIISNGNGGPSGSLNFITLYMFQRGFGDLQMGYASAIAWLVFIAVGIVALIFFKTSKNWVHYTGDEN